jgi:hypothetical protein
MEKFVDKLQKDHPGISFIETGIASWSPRKRQVSYSGTDDEINIWATLHELGHAVLDHQSYENDVSLLQKEAEAWNRALLLANKYGITIPDTHIQDCLDTYRDWVHKRSICPTCGNHGLQQSQSLYCCLNCQGTWKVTSARFCRPYRLKMALAA